MDIKQLETFVNVIDNRSFTKTAEQLFMTQPTVSVHIAALERDFNTVLLIRTSKDVFPSKAGQILYRHAKKMLAIRDNALREVGCFEQDMEGTVSIGTSSIPGQYYLPKLLAEFNAAYPKVFFRVSTYDSAQTVENLAERKIELGMTGTVIPSKKCLYRHFANDRLVIIAPNTETYQAIHRLGHPLEELLRSPYITREAGSGTRAESELILRELGTDHARLNIVAEFQDTESIKNSVARGLGISIVSRCAAEELAQFGRLLIFEFDEKPRTRRLYLVREKTDILSPVSQAFYDFCTHYYLG